MTLALREQLQDHADPEKALPMQAYMKTEQLFYGVQARPRRKLFKATTRQFKQIAREEYEQIIFELWNGSHREEMYQALEVAEHYKTYRDIQSWPIYEKLVKTATWWDTLDWIAGKLISPLVKEHRKLESKLVVWSKSKNLWVRRASLLAHLHHKGATNTQLLADTILSLCGEQEFFIRKAIGWILRDYAHANPDWVEKFVITYQDRLSGLSTREALKNLR